MTELTYFDLDLDGSIGVADDDQERVDRAKDGEVVPVRDPRAVAARPSRGKLPLYWDLETVPDESRLESFNLPPLPPILPPTAITELPSPASVIAGTADQVKATLNKYICPDEWLALVATAEIAGKNRSGVKDLIKAADFRRVETENAHEDRIKLLSCTPEYCAIAAIGAARGNGEVNSVVVGEPHPYTRGDDYTPLVTERDILESFWAAAMDCEPLIGFNILNFDFPVILARSAILGIPATRRIDLSPYGHEVVDVYLKRFGGRGNTDKNKPGKLKELAPLYGIDVPSDCDGSQVYGLMQTPEGRQRVGEYVRSDVHVLREFHKRLAGYFWV